MNRKSFVKIFGVILTIFLFVSCNKNDALVKDATRLEALIAEANAIADTATEGSEPGLFPVGSIDILRMNIDSANKLMQASVTQFGIDLAEIVMQKAIANFKSSVQIGKQLYFDGTGYLDGGIATPYNTNYITLEAWIYPTEWKNAMYIISTEGTQSGYKLQCPSGKPTFQIGNGTSVFSIAATTAINLNQWTHVAASFDGAKMKLYVNGLMVVQKDLIYKIVDNGVNFRIGEGSKFTSRTFKGRIKEVRIWDHALTDADITASLTNKLTGTEPGLTAYWPFNLSAGNTILDRTGKYYVTLINMQYVDPI